VDRVIHVAADPANPTGNVIVVSTTREQIIAGAGSRYTASSPLAQIDEALAGGGSFAFVAKPCDVSALRRLATVDPRVERHVPLMLSFFCGGMPSSRGIGRILSAMGAAPAEVIGFRYRGQGWPGTAAATLQDGRVLTMSYAQSWGEYLSKEVQFRCKICPDAVGGVADIACADAWYGGESGYPTFEEQDGRSLIVTRSVAGEALFNSALLAGKLDAQPLDVREIDLMQPAQARRKRLVAARTAALALTGNPRPRMAGVQVREAAMRAGLRETIQNCLGTVRRIVLGRW
jgi:coenzyme F420 hydrogenase subunit beta